MKIINKKFMSDRGRSYWISNEIKVLKQVSAGNPHVVQVPSTEEDAAGVIRTVLEALAYLHAQNVVHRDIKPENLLFRTKESKDVVITDFGLAKAITNDFKLRTYVGTRGYIAPEVQTMTGHGTSVDMWSVGVMTFFWLSGYSPFYKDEEYNSKRGKFAFEPIDTWSDISLAAQDFIRKLIVVDPAKRMTAVQALEHVWIVEYAPPPPPRVGQGVGNDVGVRRISTKDLSPQITSGGGLRSKFRSLVKSALSSSRSTVENSSGMEIDQKGEKSGDDEMLLD
ncbi:kinase-like domain-containing protein [Obelidium mucronatum]|nr:kinase-like domain-containing protein [Obelidium mucronatum]